LRGWSNNRDRTLYDCGTQSHLTCAQLVHQTTQRRSTWICLLFGFFGVATRIPSSQSHNRSLTRGCMYHWTWSGVGSFGPGIIPVSRIFDVLYLDTKVSFAHEIGMATLKLGWEVCHTDWDQARWMGHRLERLPVWEPTGLICQYTI